MTSTTKRVGSMVPKPQTRIVRLRGTPRRLGPRIE